MRHQFCLFLLPLSIAALSTAFPQTIFYGDSASLGNGVVRTWVQIESSGNPLAIGVSLTSGVLSNLPTSETSFSLNLPSVTADTLFKHVYFWWNPNGHPPPQVYGLPHFDAHFYFETRQAREAIAGGTDLVPSPQFVAPGYDGGNPPSAIPQMGSHWIDSTAPEWHGQVFTKTFLYGYWRGKLYFLEPMFTRAYLQSNPTDTLVIRQPLAYQRAGFYPTRYSLTFNATNQTYDIVLRQFLYRSTTAIVETHREIPVVPYLEQNYPNPFNPNTKIGFSIPVGGFASLRIYDLLGREAATLVNEMFTAGTYEVTFDGSNLASGVYFYKLQAGSYTSVKRMLLLR